MHIFSGKNFVPPNVDCASYAYDRLRSVHYLMSNEHASIGRCVSGPADEARNDENMIDAAYRVGCCWPRHHIVGHKGVLVDVSMINMFAVSARSATR